MIRSPIHLLTPVFFDRDPRPVARSLLGKLLIRKVGRRRLVGRIVETEAYLGAGDDAAHSAAGKTKRNAVLWGPPGYAYVYFIYGNHYCLNVSCLPDGQAGCVLFRALEPVEAIEDMAAARGITLSANPSLRSISSGPGRLCEALGITRDRDNGKDLTSAKSDLQLGEDGYRVRRLVVSQRIGITKSTAEPLRYALAENAFVSAPRLPALPPVRR